MEVGDGAGPTGPPPTRSRNLFSCACPRNAKISTSPHPATTANVFRRAFFITVLRSARPTPQVCRPERRRELLRLVDTCAGSRAGRLQFPLMSVGLRHLLGKYKIARVNHAPRPRRCARSTRHWAENPQPLLTTRIGAGAHLVQLLAGTSGSF